MAPPVAVLVDGDNISGKHAAAILALAKTHGDATITRVYLDAQRGQDWSNALGYRVIHAGSGKNAADILLALDAMEMVLTKGVRNFVIASSDGDFTHLALRLRECGAKVIGAGEAKAPATFRASASAFVQIGAQPVIKLVAQPQVQLSDLEVLIRNVIAAHSTKGQGVLVTELNAMLRAQCQVQISALPEKNWRSYLAARPALFDIDPRSPQARVRFKPSGFAQAA